MSRHSEPAFSVQIGAHGPDDLSVSGVSGTEGVSRLYDFRVDFFTKDGEPLVMADLIGKDALVTLSVCEGSPRYAGKARAPEGVAALEIYDYPAGYVTPSVGKSARTCRAVTGTRASGRSSTGGSGTST